MMKRPQNWDDVKPVEGGFQKLTPGGHVCEIVEAKATKSKSGKDMLVIAFDIKGGEFDGYFMNMFSRIVSYNGGKATWPNDGVYRQLAEGESLGRFKAMLMNIEKSNPGYKWDWNEQSLKGKKFGGLFREEEWEGHDKNGNPAIKTSIRCFAIKPVDGIEDEPVPSPKLLDRHTSTSASGGFNGNYGGGFGKSVADEDIPF